ncbi:hypothetical protein [Bathymodiolus platifrons methanotrophic gill symbiont]|nr:hypothetical protein [Bathymodiolus platifrons methanotrophic gill symbiont]
MGDALNALRPQRLRTKAASSLLPTGWTAIRNAILAPLACC